MWRPPVSGKLLPAIALFVDLSASAGAHATLTPVSCVVETDAPDDATGGFLPGDSRDPATDIVSVGLGADASVLATDVEVADLSPPPTARGEAYLLRWRGPDGGGYSLRIDREADGVRARYWTPQGSGEARAELDVGARVVRATVARSDIGLPDGAVLSAIRVDAFSTISLGSEGRDRAPDRSDDVHVRFLIGAACEAQPRDICPVAVDSAGDARPLVTASVGNFVVPDNEPALDLLAVGATTDTQMAHVSARMADLRSPAPVWSEALAFTISWSIGTQRWAAQAKRNSDAAVTFTYGHLDGGDGSEPRGPLRDGTPTTGSYDIAANTVAIDVPRAALGSPPDGTPFDHLGAVALAYLVEDLVEDVEDIEGDVSAPMPVDSTATHPYELGTSCGA